MLEHSGNSGNFAGGVGEYIDSDTDVLLDGNNQIVGRLETRSVREFYDVNLDDNVHVVSRQSIPDTLAISLSDRISHNKRHKRHCQVGHRALSRPRAMEAK